MQRFVSYALALLLVATSAYGAAFTSGNFLILYANSPSMSMASVDITSTSVEEFTKAGESVQVIDIGDSCATDLNIYTGCPKESTDGQYVSFYCRIPNGAVTNNYQLTASVAVLDSEGVLDTSTQFTSTVKMYRGTVDGDHVYISGNDLLGYTPFKTAESMINLTPGIRFVQDVYVWKGSLYVTNWSYNNWGLAAVGSTLPLTTAPQDVTEVWPTSFIMFPDTITFFESGDVEYMYLADEDTFELHRLQKISGTWSKLYSTSTGFAASQTIITSQIFYENGDGTNTVLFATMSRVFKVTDTGAGFEGMTEIVSRADKTIKGISWVPTSAAAPVAAPVATPIATPVATPEATPVATPEATPVATPEATPLATPIADPPVADAPIAEPGTATPIGEVPNAPVRAPTSSNAPTKSPTGKVSGAVSLTLAISLIAIGVTIAL